MQLALGTVQFGLAYGIAGSGRQVHADEARRILQSAWSAGVRILDTAAAYGDIEPRLASLCGKLDFQLISKVPAIPDALMPEAAAAWALSRAEASQRHLGQRLRGLMCHRAEDLMGERGAAVHAALARWAAADSVTLGASCYDPATLRDLRCQHPIGLAQLPGNALDQRLNLVYGPQDLRPDLHLRSAFLQGLLLMPEAEAARRLPRATSALRSWHAWCAGAGLTPLVGALSVVKSLTSASTVVVGVETLTQFEQIARAWSQARATPAAELAQADPHIIDPRTWTT